MIVILLIVLLLFGAKKLPELARGMGRAVKEFSAARDEIERELRQSGPNVVVPPKLLDQKGELHPVSDKVRLENPKSSRLRLAESGNFIPRACDQRCDIGSLH
ncbi:MAG: twin-arginine translocase TatA/TatE family subunit [Candidatus Udaeobacter sp.]